MSLEPSRIDAKLGVILPLERNNRILRRHTNGTGVLPFGYRRMFSFSDLDKPESGKNKAYFTYICRDSFTPVSAIAFGYNTRARLDYDEEGNPETFLMRELPDPEIDELEFRSRAIVSEDNGLTNHEYFYFHSDSDTTGEWLPLSGAENGTNREIILDHKYKMVLYLRALITASIYTKHELEAET